jgi:hypothetical protein
MANELDIKKLGLYLVEGFVEVDSTSGQVVVRTEDPEGRVLDFDPVPILRELKGQEVRVVIVPLASVFELETLAKRLEDTGEASVIVDPPGSN